MERVTIDNWKRGCKAGNRGNEVNVMGYWEREWKSDRVVCVQDSLRPSYITRLSVNGRHQEELKGSIRHRMMNNHKM